MILDAGPEDGRAVTGKVEALATLIWNGPLGVFEIKPFDKGHQCEAAKEAARLTRPGRLVSVAGGGDTVAALNKAGVADDLHSPSSRRRAAPSSNGWKARNCPASDAHPHEAIER
jgi:phosphoglycerate kinase